MAESPLNPLLQVDSVAKSFGGPTPVEVLRGISFELRAGEGVAITGPSGSGKSTLLHVIGTLDRPTSGSVHIDTRDPFALPEPELARFRNEVIGFVFQDHHLLPQCSVLENVLLPVLAFHSMNPEAISHAKFLLDRVGLSHRIEHHPAELSGGERQRAAVARALINRPRLLLCDEPTGSLDRSTAASVASLLMELHREQENVLVVVTHSTDLAGLFEKRFELNEGRI